MGEIQESDAWVTEPEARMFAACAFCAMQRWSEELLQKYIAGPQCFMASPHLVAQELDTDWYKSEWPLIPPEELDASSVLLPHVGLDGNMTTTRVLMHKRWVPEGALSGQVPVRVCTTCFDAFSPKKPHLSKYSLANYLWLGRHPPIFRYARLGHQLLLALGRVISTKVYLSSEGLDEGVRQAATTWRQRFLQSGIKGTSIVFANGRADEAMASFPPTAEEIHQTFVAVFTGPEQPTDAERALLESNDPADEETRERMARERLRREVELEVDRDEYDAQARRLQATNKVYADACYRVDLVEKLPAERAVPQCFECCATFLRVDAEDVDVARASGPASSTTTGEQEREAAEADADKLSQWLSIVDEDDADAAEMTSLPALERLLERMESQAGRVVANELMARVEESGATDEVGRNRLVAACRDFHAVCAKASPTDEAQALLWRVQALAEKIHARGSRQPGASCERPACTEKTATAARTNHTSAVHMVGSKVLDDRQAD